MENIEEVKKFIGNRPDVVAAYAYGSNAFHQANDHITKGRQNDLILVVKDLKRWHQENMKNNPEDYSIIGRHFFENASIDELKGLTGVTYISNIPENGLLFKYGTIEDIDLMMNLKTWKSFYMPGRFQKPVYPVIENEILKKYITENRKKAHMIACLLHEKGVITKSELFKIIASLSYIGDTRMGIAENPNKVNNIINGSYGEFYDIYSFNADYLSNVVFNKLSVDRFKIIESFDLFPEDLKEYIEQHSETRVTSEVVDCVKEYFTTKNREESMEQTIKGIKTNGIVRSAKYASRKLQKRLY